MNDGSPASALWLCAREELTLGIRSRWTRSFAVVFGGLALAVAVSGYVLSGGSGVQDFSRTAASLVQLVLLLVPLTTLFTAVNSLAADRGSAELLFSQPVARRTILFGRLLGLFEALVAAQAVGFGCAGLVVFWQVGEEGIGAFLYVTGAAVVLTVIFLGIAALVAAGSTARRARALGVALVVWFVAVALFDLAVLGAASVMRSGHASRLLIVASLLNPVDAVRTGSLLGIEGTAAFGAASLALLRFAHGPGAAAVLIAASLAAWAVVPLAIAVRRLDRADL